MALGQSTPLLVQRKHLLEVRACCLSTWLMVGKKNLEEIKRLTKSYPTGNICAFSGVSESKSSEHGYYLY